MTTVTGETAYKSFADLMVAATRTGDHPLGLQPYAYQARIAAEGFPDVIHVPTGAGKTEAAVLPWLYRCRFHSDMAVRADIPRRLVLALPTRALTDQTEERVRAWVAALGLADEVAIHVMMGGRLDPRAAHEWRVNLHRPTIVIGTIDMVVSRALMRGYGMYRPSYPIDFALIANGAQIVVDEVQLAGQATTTLRQIAAFQRRCGTAEPYGLTVMSATVDERLLDTVDNPFSARTATVVGLSDDDRSGHLAGRLAATRTIHRLPEIATPKAFAQAVLDRHQAGSLTLVIVNTVESAVDTYQQLAKLAGAATPTLLIHSRFRGIERAGHMRRLKELASSGGIVVSTQAIEAGVDIDARTLVTEVAPWSSIVQRAGRCNRAGKLTDGEATVWWIVAKKPEPYAGSDVAAAAEVLEGLEGQPVTSQELYDAGRAVPPPDQVLRILRWRDFEQLFDTTPDLAGSDLDIRPFIRPDLDLDVQVAWVPDDWGGDERRSALPDEALRCPVSIGKIDQLIDREGVRAWVFEPSQDRFVSASSRRLRPQDVVLVASSSGGYDPVLGYAPTSRKQVETAPPPTDVEDGEHSNPDPVGQAREEDSDVSGASAAELPEGPAASEEPGSANPLGGWLALDRHLDDASAQARGLIHLLDPLHLDPAIRRAVVAAAALHDIGKAHPDWQEALLTANAGNRPEEGIVGPWAKSPRGARLRIKRGGQSATGTPRIGFRHELISVFMLSTPTARDLLEHLDVPAELQPLVRYLVAAHHGHIRLTARDPRWDGRDGRGVFGCFDGDETPALDIGDYVLPPTRVDLGIFHAGRADSWTEYAVAALERYGPFRLAYLETLVRMADWRASAGLPIVGGRS